ncbi:MAG: formate/nitrite transporter family protein [Gemmatimonadota bacterium]|nr:formate/nitrite transporter family protein [Gemmatimonadota bacterium]
MSDRSRVRPTAPPERHQHAGEDPGDRAAELEADEHKKAEEEESLTAAITHEVLRREGQKELERPMSALAWSGLAAGLSMGFSFVTEGLLRSHLPETPWRPLVVKLGYPVGFVIVTLASQELYTENTLRPIIPLMAKRTKAMLRRVSLLWLVVLVTNLLGALLFTWVIAESDAFRPEVREAFRAIGREAAEGTFWTVVIRGVFAGWLIALMVWMLPAAQSAQILVIVVLTWIVGVAGLSHIIAGSTAVMYAAIVGEVGADEYLGDFMAPTLIGNTIGGVSLVAALNHAQVVAGQRKAL